MEDAAVVRVDIVFIEEQAFLHCFNPKKKESAWREWGGGSGNMRSVVHRLKLVTGVEISTRPVNRSGRPGKKANRASRRAAAPAKTPALLFRVIAVDMA